MNRERVIYLLRYAVARCYASSAVGFSCDDGRAPSQQLQLTALSFCVVKRFDERGGESKDSPSSLQTTKNTKATKATK